MMITMNKEVMYAIRTIKKQKATGLDKIPAEIVTVVCFFVCFMLSS